MRRDRGFTLVELMAALVVGGAVLLMAHRVFGGLLDGVAVALERREALDTEANARRRLSVLVGVIEVGGDAGGFDGAPDRMQFDTWLESPEGWPDRHTITLVATGGALVERHDDEELRLFEGVDSLRVDYLLVAGADERWARRWLSSSSVPVAVRLRVARGARTDTLLLTVGSRG